MIRCSPPSSVRFSRFLHGEFLPRRSLVVVLCVFGSTMFVHAHSHWDLDGFSSLMRALAFMSHCFFFCGLSCYSLRSQQHTHTLHTRKIYYFRFWLIIFSYAVERIHIQENANDKMLPSMSCSSARIHCTLGCIYFVFGCHFVCIWMKEAVFFRSTRK